MATTYRPGDLSIKELRDAAKWDQRLRQQEFERRETVQEAERVLAEAKRRTAESKQFIAELHKLANAPIPRPEKNYYTKYVDGKNVRIYDDPVKALRAPGLDPETERLINRMRDARLAVPQFVRQGIPRVKAQTEFECDECYGPCTGALMDDDGLLYCGGCYGLIVDGEFVDDDDVNRQLAFEQLTPLLDQLRGQQTTPGTGVTYSSSAVQAWSQSLEQQALQSTTATQFMNASANAPVRVWYDTAHGDPSKKRDDRHVEPIPDAAGGSKEQSQLRGRSKSDGSQRSQAEFERLVFGDAYAALAANDPANRAGANPTTPKPKRGILRGPGRKDAKAKQRKR